MADNRIEMTGSGSIGSDSIGSGSMLNMALDLAGNDGVFTVEFPDDIREDPDSWLASAADAGERFLKAASLLPEDAFLGWQTGARDKGAEQLVSFSGPGKKADREDFCWIFEGAAKIGDFRCGKPEDLRAEGNRLYLLCMDMDSFGEAQDSGETQDSGAGNISREPRAEFFWDFVKEVRDSGGIVRGIVRGGRRNCGMILISLREGISLRIRTMLSMAFPGTAAVEITADSTGLCPTGSLTGGLMAFSAAETLREFCMEAMCREVDKTPISGKTPIDELGFSVRAANCLLRAGINTLGDLCAMTDEEIAGVRNLGKKCTEEVLAFLRRRRAAVRFADTEMADTPADTSVGSLVDTPAPSRKHDWAAMLEELVGLENVKTQVRKITAFARMKQDLAAWGKASVPMVLNMEFQGNPGTAKTTVARILAGLFADAGVIRSGEAVEVGRADLVAEYTGQTAVKVRDVFRKAEGKLLFIDEAYSLVDGIKAGYGDEAISTIVQEMENHRDDTIVIFAGYPDQMEEFFRRNPGLRSRVPFTLRFRDYTAAEMARIAGLEAEKRGFSICPEAEETVLSVCAAAAGQSEMGNGRFCRNLVESAVLNYAYRVYGNGAESGNAAPEDKDFVLRVQDFTAVGCLTERKVKAPAGFRPVRRQQLSNAV